jgi:hypothetical protein
MTMQPAQFYEVLPDGRYRFRVDHHTISDYNTCDRYFSYRHMTDAAGMVWGGKTLSIKIALGSWWSSVMESLYHEMTFGVLPSEHTVYKFATEEWLAHKIDDYKNTEAEYYDKFGGVDGGRLMALEYYEQFARHHFNEWQIVGAELGFGWSDECFLGEDDRVVVYYGGKPDLIFINRAERMIMPLDFKTKDSVPSNANVQYKPHPQTAGYIFAVTQMLNGYKGDSVVLPPTKCVIMVCSRIRPTDKPRSGVRAPRFAPVYPAYSVAEIAEWQQSVIEKCRRLRESIERNYFPPREASCHLFYHGCMFRRVCSTPPNARDMMLNADFVKIDPWVPYVAED